MKTAGYPKAAAVGACFCVLPSVICSSLVLDLSYKPRLNVDTLATAIGDIVWNVDDKRQDAVEVDVSSSVLGDGGIKKVVEILLPNDKRFPLEGRLKTLHLSVRMNQLSPLGVTNILKAIIASKSSDDGSAASDTDRDSWYLRSLDMGWNDLNPEADGSKAFLAALKTVLASERCPQVLRFDQCAMSPACCRAIGKGIMNRFNCPNSTKDECPQALALHLCGNEAVSDAGVAALAAALRTSVLRTGTDGGSKLATVFDILDLSSCGVSDAGAEALAMALETYPLCIRHLDLSNNCISDEGAAVLAGALAKAKNFQGGFEFALERLDLSNNKEIGDRGASALAKAMELGHLMDVSLRSCNVRADGAKAFGRVLHGLSLNNSRNDGDCIRKVDLSGNPLGVLRGKAKSGGKYSATKLKSKASATASSYMSFIGKNIRSGLKDVGLDVGGQTAESDDDEEDQVGMDADAEFDPAKARCGAKSFVHEVFNVAEELEEKVREDIKEVIRARYEVAMRHCFLDTGGADGLAAAVMEAEERLGTTLDVDVRMNNVLEPEMIAALRNNDDSYRSTLEKMAERHLDAMESLRIAEDRAAEAAAAATSRVSRSDDEWGADDDEHGMFGVHAYDNDYDSDAMYDNNDNYGY